MKTFQTLAATLVLAGTLGVAQAQAVRPEVGKPLQQASELLRANKAKEALAKVREADAVPNKTPAEQTMVERMRGAAAQRAGDNATAIQAFEALFPKLSGAEAAQVAESVAFAYSQQKDWPRTSQWIQKAQSLGSTSAQLKQLQAYVQGQSGDYGAIAKEAAAAVAAAEQAGRRPDEGDLLRLADAQARTGNAAGQTATLDKLLANYPKREYWSIYLGRLPRKSGFSDRFSLDVMRLKLATGNLAKTEEFMEMAQLSLQAGYPAEGKAIVDKGFAAGALGTGAEAERHKRLRDLANKQEAEAKASIEQRAKEAATAKDGNDLVQIGYAYATMGQADKGIPLIEQGIAKGGLKRPEDAKLRLGLALLQSGKAKTKAVQTLRGVQGTDGGADLGRLWALYAQVNN
ncbi:MAG: hypothetical protein HY855_17505 [Burkholderiales bacterium]|nr:hypothetical protein [Burkholderiales bacterium]